MKQIYNSYENDNSFIGPLTSHKLDKYCSVRIDRLETIVGKVVNIVGTITSESGFYSLVT